MSVGCRPDALNVIVADAAFRGADIQRSSQLRRRDYLDRAVAGGFPETVRRAPRRRAAFFDSYISTLIERDVLEIASIERRGDLLKLLALLAGRAGSILVPAALAGASGIPRTTLVRYLELLSIETPDGRVVAVGVKAGATVRTEDLAGLRNLAGHLRDKFVAGYVMYTGQQTLSFGGRIKAIPVDALWELEP